MVKQKRERLKIIKEILGVILLNRNTGSTKIMQKANLSPQMFDEYKNYLIEKELILLTITDKKEIINGKKFKAGKKCYNLTELGRQYLEDYRVVDNFLEKYGMDEE